MSIPFKLFFPLEIILTTLLLNCPAYPAAFDVRLKAFQFFPNQNFVVVHTDRFVAIHFDWKAVIVGFNSTKKELFKESVEKKT